jgi:hypothetical protein
VSLPSPTLSFAPQSAPPPFVRGGFASLDAPFRAALAIVQGHPGDLTLATRLSVCSGLPAVLVWWELARDPCFARLERYGLLTHRPASGELTIALTALELGRSYWARLWAGGSWSTPAHVRVRSHERSERTVREQAGLATAGRLASIVRREAS